MAPPRRIVREQLEILIDFLESNRDMSKGLLPSAPMSHQAMRHKWAVLAKKLNAVESGALKAPDGWKKYWFEWRHKCRKKAANAKKFQSDPNASSSRFVPLNDLEIRVLELNGEGSVSAAVSSSKQLENFITENSDNEDVSNDESIDESVPVKVKVRQSISSNNSKMHTDEARVTPPPRWALDLEERRIASQERMADALQSIASTLRSQEERRSMLDDRIADTLTALAGTIQDLNSGVHDMIQHIQSTSQTERSYKEVVLL
ncbi:unnamed protein product [Colias eurytheme]|nr:unnamed protein product [Colias eurytheme]